MEKELNEELEREEKRRFVDSDEDGEWIEGTEDEFWNMLSELDNDNDKPIIPSDEDDFDIDNLLEELESLTDEEYEAKQQGIREENYRIVKGFE